jgi:hypothetical protein
MRESASWGIAEQCFENQNFSRVSLGRPLILGYDVVYRTKRMMSVVRRLCPPRRTASWSTGSSRWSSNGEIHPVGESDLSVLAGTIGW